MAERKKHSDHAMGKLAKKKVKTKKEYLRKYHPQWNYNACVLSLITMRLICGGQMSDSKVLMPNTTG
jgi:hypothetical protein